MNKLYLVKRSVLHVLLSTVHSKAGDLGKVKKNNTHYCIYGLVKVILKEMRKKNIIELSEEHTIEGYTRATTTTKDGDRVIFYAHPYFQQWMWYDWAYDHFEEITASGEAAEKYYSSKILSFTTMSGTPVANKN